MPAQDPVTPVEVLPRFVGEAWLGSTRRGLFRSTCGLLSSIWAFPGPYEAFSGHYQAYPGP